MVTDLRPVLPSTHGGIDDDSWIGEVDPELMLLVSPLGEAERPAYLQWYLIDAKVMCVGDQTNKRAEDEARVQAAYLGGALMLLVQQPSLGGLAQDLTILLASEDAPVDGLQIGRGRRPAVGTLDRDADQHAAVAHGDGETLRPGGNQVRGSTQSGDDLYDGHGERLHAWNAVVSRGCY